MPDDDPAWYALRNVVYAFGCRASTFKEGVSDTWSEAQSKGWCFFENALAVHTELVYFRSNLSAVQALLAMVSCVRYHQKKSINPGYSPFSWRAWAIRSWNTCSSAPRYAWRNPKGYICSQPQLRSSPLPKWHFEADYSGPCISMRSTLPIEPEGLRYVSTTLLHSSCSYNT